MGCLYVTPLCLGRRARAYVSLLATALAWLAVAQLPDGWPRVNFLNVGLGDAVLITTPTRQPVLVDGGPSPSAFTSALGDEMAFWDRSSDPVIRPLGGGKHTLGFVLCGLADSGFGIDGSGW
jgi:hypothetical protein